MRQHGESKLRVTPSCQRVETLSARSAGREPSDSEPVRRVAGFAPAKVLQQRAIELAGTRSLGAQILLHGRGKVALRF